MKPDRKNCPMRHENGNCTVAGGFCTAVNDSICEALHNAYECGKKKRRKITMREALINLLNQEPCPATYTCSNTCKYVESPHCFEERYADHLIKNNVIILPCRKGDPVYQIKKFCDENIGCYEFYRPTKEFDRPCQYYEETWDGTMCQYPGLVFDEKWHCNLDCDIYCDVCKERFAVQADRFSYGMIEHIYNTPMFDKTLSLENILFLTKEEAEDVLDKYLKGEWPNG